MHDLFSTVARTAADTLDLVDVDTLAGIVAVLRELLPAVHATVTVPVGH